MQANQRLIATNLLPRPPPWLGRPLVQLEEHVASPLDPHQQPWRRKPHRLPHLGAWLIFNGKKRKKARSVSLKICARQILMGDWLIARGNSAAEANFYIVSSFLRCLDKTSEWGLRQSMTIHTYDFKSKEMRDNNAEAALISQIVMQRRFHVP